MKTLIIFPNNLFEFKYLPKNVEKIFIVEEPIFFGYRNLGVRKPNLNFNKKKILLHRSSMKYYFEYLSGLKKLSRSDIKYIDFNNIGDYNFLSKDDEIFYFELNDKILEKKMYRVSKKFNITELDNPNFLLKSKDLEIFFKENKNKKIRHSTFYNFSKKRLNIELGKSTDYLNRNKLDISAPNLKSSIKTSKKYMNKNKEYVEKYFSNNYGTCENLNVPVTHLESKKWLQDFLNNRFKNYGKYQDSIHFSKDRPKHEVLFHSGISPMLNIGLLSPCYVVEQIKLFKNSGEVPVNSYEGFLRQLIGWREFQRYTYKYYYEDMKNNNYFGNNKHLKKLWWKNKEKDSTGIPIIDLCISSGFESGYLHHILRLMVMSNIFNLLRIHPDDVYKWFMEFSIDSYDWVMIQNVYSMGMWSDGGVTMRKPYITSSSYIISMSNGDLIRKGEWQKIWNSLFYKFLEDNEDEIMKTPYKRNLVWYKSQSIDYKKEIKKISNKIISQLTI